MEYCCGFFGGAVLDYLREAQEARMATPVRRIYDFASAAIILVVMALVFAGLVPLWIFWTAFPVSLGLGALLTRKWIREDALKGYRAGQPEQASTCRGRRRQAQQMPQEKTVITSGP